MDDAILQHFGILGMKWGKRRAPLNISSEHAQSRDLKKKHISEMSNEELKKINTRLQLEKTYKELSVQDVSAGRKFVNTFIQNQGQKLAEKVAIGAAAGTEKIVKQLIVDKVPPKVVLATLLQGLVKKEQ